jgi:hypothetical protein
MSLDSRGAAFRLDTVMNFPPDLALGRSLTGSLDYRQHLRHPQVTQQVRLVVIWLLWLLKVMPDWLLATLDVIDIYGLPKFSKKIFSQVI